MIAAEDYFQYLQGRSRLGLLYRRHWLYPRLNKHLMGTTLDVGCGIGDFLSYRRNAVGVDINPVTVAWCQKQGLDAHLMTSDLLPFENAAFDSVIFDNVLEHLSAPLPLLQEIHRVLMPNGRLIVGVPGKRGYACDPDHKIYYDAGSLVSTLSAAQFRSVRIFGMPFESAWLDEHMRQYCIYGVFQRV